MRNILEYGEVLQLYKKCCYASGAVCGDNARKINKHKFIFFPNTQKILNDILMFALLFYPKIFGNHTNYSSDNSSLLLFTIYGKYNISQKKRANKSLFALYQ